MEECVKKNIMSDWLKAHWWEVFEMVNLWWNEEAAKKFYTAEAKEEGRMEGRAETTIAMVLNLFKEKMSAEFISRVTALPLEKVAEIGKAHGVL